MSGAMSAPKGAAGVIAALLAQAGLIRGDRDSVRLLSRLFRTDPEPFNTFVF